MLLIEICTELTLIGICLTADGVLVPKDKALFWYARLDGQSLVFPHEIRNLGGSAPIKDIESIGLIESEETMTLRMTGDDRLYVLPLQCMA